MYDTLLPGVKASIDSKVFENNEAIVSGWCFSELNGVCPIRCRYDGSFKNISVEVRPDIVTKFNRNNIILCGWKLQIPINKFVDLQIKIDETWSSFLSFNTLHTFETNNTVNSMNIDSIIPERTSNEIIVPQENKTESPTIMINFSRN